MFVSIEVWYDHDLKSSHWSDVRYKWRSVVTVHVNAIEMKVRVLISGFVET